MTTRPCPGTATTLTLLVLALAAAPLWGDPLTPATACRLLPPAEAAQVIGPGPDLLTALEGGACQYRRGALTLEVPQPVTLDDARIIAQAYEAMASSERGTPVSGIGDRAFLAKENSGYRVMFVKGKTLAGAAVYGEESDAPEMGEKLIAAALKIAARL
jgi:hypothetical protein